MRINIEKHTSINAVSNYKDGIKPHYAPKGSTMQGVVYCPDHSGCGICIGNLMKCKDNTVVGWFETTCPRCGKQIDWSNVSDNI